MSLTIGRASISSNPSSMETDGDSLSVAGWFVGSDLNHAKALRQQLLGLANNPDEPVVPFTSTVDTALDGFYRVASARVTPVLGVSYEKFRFQYAVDLERIGGGFTNPTVEVAVLTPLRTNSHSITSAFALSPGGIVYASLTDLDYDPDGLSDTYSAPVESADGDATLLYTDSAGGAASTSWFPRFYVSPANFYKAAAKLEIKYGSTWYEVSGRQIPNSVGGNWRVSNGFVRFGPSSTLGRAVLEAWDAGSAAWVNVAANVRRGVDSAGTFTEWDMFCADPAGTNAAYSNPMVLRNDPAAISVMVAGAQGGSETYTLRRGAFGVDVTHVHYSSVALGVSAGEASAAVSLNSSTVGSSRGSDDANGNRWVFASASAVTNDTTNGETYLTSSATSWSFMIGCYTAEYGTAARSAFGHIIGTSARERVVLR